MNRWIKTISIINLLALVCLIVIVVLPKRPNEDIGLFGTRFRSATGRGAPSEIVGDLNVTGGITSAETITVSGTSAITFSDSEATIGGYLEHLGIGTEDGASTITVHDTITFATDVYGSKVVYPFACTNKTGNAYITLANLAMSDNRGIPLIRDGSIVGAGAYVDVTSYDTTGTLQIATYIDAVASFTSDATTISDTTQYLISGTASRGTYAFTPSDQTDTIIKIKILRAGTGATFTWSAHGWIEVYFDD